MLLSSKLNRRRGCCLAAIVGHVGDGNFHVILPVFEGDEEEMKVVYAFSDRLVRFVLNWARLPLHSEWLNFLKFLLMKKLARAHDFATETSSLSSLLKFFIFA